MNTDIDFVCVANRLISTWILLTEIVSGIYPGLLLATKHYIYGLAV